MNAAPRRRVIVDELRAQGHVYVIALLVVVVTFLLAAGLHDMGKSVPTGRAAAETSPPPFDRPPR